MADSFTYDVFLSHNRQDKPRVRALAERLRDAGLRVWLDEWVIRPGDDIYLAIERGLEAARVQVLCLSPAALGSDWVALERSTVLFRDPSNAGRRFVPLLLADCTLPDTLRRYKFVDFRQETPAAFEELLVACREEVEAAPLAPQPKKKPAKQKPKTKRPTEQAQPLAVPEHKLIGHTGLVLSVAVSPDGKWIASGSADKMVKIWDLQTGKIQATLRGHTDIVKSVAITPDGKQILSGSADSAILLWDLVTHKKAAKLIGHRSAVYSVSGLYDGEHVFSAGTDDTLRLWDITNDSCLVLQTGLVTTGGGATTPDGKVSVAVSGDDIMVWNLKAGILLRTLKGHYDTVFSVQIMSDGRFAVSGSKDRTVKIWDLKAGTCMGTLEGHIEAVYSVAISTDGTLIASTGYWDKTVRIWDWK
jgi:WD40 repeat protein